MVREFNDEEKGELVASALSCFRRGGTSLDQFPTLIARIIETKAWESRKSRRGKVKLGSLRELIEKPPHEGWGESVDSVGKLLKKTDVEKDWLSAIAGENPLPEPGGDRRSDQAKSSLHCQLENGGGNAASYLLRRIARDHPETLAKFEAGDFPSVRQAAIAAGIVKVKTPAQDVIDRFARLSDEDKRTVRHVIERQGGESGREDGGEGFASA